MWCACVVGLYVCGGLWWYMYVCVVYGGVCMYVCVWFVCVVCEGLCMCGVRVVVCLYVWWCMYVCVVCGGVLWRLVVCLCLSM